MKQLVIVACCLCVASTALAGVQAAPVKKPGYNFFTAAGRTILKGLSAVGDTLCHIPLLTNSKDVKLSATLPLVTLAFEWDFNSPVTSGTAIRLSTQKVK